MIIIVGREPEDISQATVDILRDRARASGVDLWSYDSVLRYAKEHYSANRTIVVPGLHLFLPTRDEILACIEAAPFDRMRIYRYNESDRMLVGTAAYGDMGHFDFIGFRVAIDTVPYMQRSLESASQQPSIMIMGRHNSGQENDQIALAMRIGPWIQAPLTLGGKFVGWLVADNKICDQEITEKDCNYMSLLAKLISQAIASGGLTDGILMKPTGAPRQLQVGKE